MSARIALMLPRFSRYGGVEQFGRRLAKELADRGHQVDFICARQEEEAPAGVRVIRVGRIGGTRFGKLLWFLLQAEKKRRQGNYDLAVSLGKNLRQDLVRMGGGPLRIYWERSERALAPGRARRIKRFIRRLSPVNHLIMWVERRQFTKDCRVVAVSHLVRRWLLEAYPALDPQKVRVIYNRPDLDRFTPPSAEERRRAREVLWKQYGAVQKEAGSCLADAGIIFLGTASTNFILKGVGPLIQSLALLPENTHLFIAGGRGSGAYRKLAVALKVADRVHFCGKVADMPAFYRALDLFILPTFYDACSNAVLEALASGCKAVTSAANGASYFLPEAAVVADPGNAEELAKSMRMHLDMPSSPFVWPQDVPSGVEAFADYMETLLS